MSPTPTPAPTQYNPGKIPNSFSTGKPAIYSVLVDEDREVASVSVIVEVAPGRHSRITRQYVAVPRPGYESSQKVEEGALDKFMQGIMFFHYTDSKPVPRCYIPADTSYLDVDAIFEAGFDADGKFDCEPRHGME